MRKLFLAATVAALAVPGFAAAAERDAEDWVYLRGGVGRNDLGGMDGFERYDGNDTAVSIGVGWRFLKYLSIDLNYDGLGKYDGASPAPGGPMDARVTALSLGLGGTLDFGRSGFFAQARVGMHRWEEKLANFETEAKLRGTDPFYALGVGYDITENFGVILSYERFLIDDEYVGDVDRLMVGFELR